VLGSKVAEVPVIPVAIVDGDDMEELLDQKTEYVTDCPDIVEPSVYFVTGDQLMV